MTRPSQFEPNPEGPNGDLPSRHHRQHRKAQALVHANASDAGGSHVSFLNLVGETTAQLPSCLFCSSGPVDQSAPPRFTSRKRVPADRRTLIFRQAGIARRYVRPSKPFFALPFGEIYAGVSGCGVLGAGSVGR